ncbi:hypothetical protein BHM03_00028306 [Ensete ventricosum]|nr:hypothetical protein BHM03_00028306 [Ensete ventricosum]
MGEIATAPSHPAEANPIGVGSPETHVHSLSLSLSLHVRSDTPSQRVKHLHTKTNKISCAQGVDWSSSAQGSMDDQCKLGELCGEEGSGSKLENGKLYVLCMRSHKFLFPVEWWSEVPTSHRTGGSSFLFPAVVEPKPLVELPRRHMSLTP